ALRCSPLPQWSLRFAEDADLSCRPRSGGIAAFHTKTRIGRRFRGTAFTRLPAVGSESARRRRANQLHALRANDASHSVFILFVSSCETTRRSGRREDTGSHEPAPSASLSVHRGKKLARNAGNAPRSRLRRRRLWRQRRPREQRHFLLLQLRH